MVLIAMFRLVLLASFLAAQLAAQSHTLTIKMTGFKTDQGMAVVALFNQPDAFPTKPEKAATTLRVPVAKGAAKAEFKNLPPGTYAVAVYHDVNNNNKMDANFIGIPKEQTGASNNAKGKVGPPAFKDARFALTGDQSLTITMN